MNHAVLTKEPLNLDKINDLVADDSCGAISFFVGTTRDNFESKKVLSLEYEAYEPMALKEIHAICGELRSRWPDIVNIAIYHRLGLVKVREASVIIAISSPHRQTALNATTQAIEDLKRRVPIWKREKYSDEEGAWKDNKECAWLSTGKNNKSNKVLDFSACTVGNYKSNIPCSQVQISAPEAEIERRIQSFVREKREQIDLSNILDFVGTTNLNTKIEDKISCARTDAFIIKQEQSKGHLRVRRARNDGGPQTRPDYLQALDKHMTHSKLNTKQIISPKNTVLNERIQNVETFLRLPIANSQSIHERLKVIENRILFLETISPEYIHFLSNPSELNQQRNEKDVKRENLFPNRRTFTIKDLDNLINEYEKEE